MSSSAKTAAAYLSDLTSSSTSLRIESLVPCESTAASCFEICGAMCCHVPCEANSASTTNHSSDSTSITNPSGIVPTPPMVVILDLGTEMMLEPNKYSA